MMSITLDEIQRDFPGYLKRVGAGETLVIMQGDKPVAELKPVDQELSQPRPYGLCAGEFTVPADFDAPLPDDVLAGFEGE
jgi:antitoxin (DNA-binding transcriptional repressor) of toxin-antitoxin stability system